MKKTIAMMMALAVAGTTFGDVVAYDPAVYGNPIVVTTDEAVTIDGTGATIDGGGKVRCATLGPNVTLRNFTLKNGFADCGGGVLGGRLERCVIAGCAATMAGGAYGTVLDGCTVSDCRASESGAALGNCTATGCRIVGNRRTGSDSKVAVHGGILFDSTLTNCELTDNVAVFGKLAPAFGGLGERVVLSGCTVKGNSVQCDDGVCYGLRHAYSKVDGTEVEFDDGEEAEPTPPPHPPAPPEDPQPDPGTYEPEKDPERLPNDGIVGRYYAPVYLDQLSGVLARSYDKKTTVKAEGLPKGLKLMKILATGGYEYAVKGVPTEAMDGVTRIAYVRITDAKKQVRLVPLALRVLPAVTAVFPPATNKVAYWHFPVSKIWPDVAANPKNWTFSGWPSGIKYATKAVTVRKKIDGVYVTLTNARPHEVYGTPKKAGRFTVKAVEKVAGTSYKSTHLATITVWPQGEAREEWTDQAYVRVYRKSAEGVKSASGLPSGIKFTAKDIVSKKVVTTEAYHFYGTPKKAGTYAVTLTHDDKSKTQFLWTITRAEAPTFELALSETEVDPETVQATIRAGVGYRWEIANTLGSKVTASGLPTGLKLSSKAVKEGPKTVGYTYAVTGVPTKAGAYFTTFKTTWNGVTVLRTAAFSVLGLPAWAQGTFDGGADEDFPVGGRATFTVSKVGKLSGKWMSEGTNWTLSAASYDRYDEAAAAYVARVVGKTGSGKKTRTFTNELAVAEDSMGGLATNGLFLAWQNNWKLNPWKTLGKKVGKAPVFKFQPYADAGDSHTNDTISLKFAASGKVTVKASYFKSVSKAGKISRTTVSGSAVLCPQAQPDGETFPAVVFVYLPPKKGTPTEKAAYAVCIRLWWDGKKFDELTEP